MKRAQGSMFVKVDKYDKEQTPEAIAGQAELRELVGEKLVASSGKLMLLDRLLIKKKREGSRVLIFSQWTLTLDVIEEYVKYRFGTSAYFRLDGETGRIQREMDMRSFNKEGSNIFCYLISTRAGGQGINLATGKYILMSTSSSTCSLILSESNILSAFAQPILSCYTIHVGTHKSICRHRTVPTELDKRSR